VVRMPWPQFLGYTLVGSAVWNGALIGAGVALGTQHELVERYVGVLDRVVVGAVVLVVVLALGRRIRRGRARLER
jgi:membrane protein DedA with SNARE-associated domain